MLTDPKFRLLCTSNFPTILKNLKQQPIYRTISPNFQGLDETCPSNRRPLTLANFQNKFPKQSKASRRVRMLSKSRESSQNFESVKPSCIVYRATRGGTEGVKKTARSRLTNEAEQARKKTASFPAWLAVPGAKHGNNMRRGRFYGARSTARIRRLCHRCLDR